MKKRVKKGIKKWVSILVPIAGLISLAREVLRMPDSIWAWLLDHWGIPSAVIFFAAAYIIAKAFNQKLHRYYNVLWDKRGQAFCPDCEEPVDQSGKYINMAICSKCDREYTLTTRGEPISLAGAAQIVRNIEEKF